MRTYKRTELETIFHTSRIDSIKRSLERAGYTFESTGRGQESTISITALPTPPTPFEAFAKREFGCGPQTNFQAMENHFFLLLYHPEYQFLPSNHQANYLEKNCGIKISDQSLRNWQKLLIDKNWMAKDNERIKYVLCRKGELPREISEELYKKAWHTYYALIENGTNRSAALHILFEKYGGMPRKQNGLVEKRLRTTQIAGIEEYFGEYSLISDIFY